jgi:drug/metabolite transporter (DMT)-like permease
VTSVRRTRVLVIILAGYLMIVLDISIASGLVNVAHQLGGSLGLGILVTVFAAAGDGLAHRVSTALTVGTGMLALALVLVVALIVRPNATPVPSVKRPLVRSVKR